MILAADNLHALNPVLADALEKLDPEPVRGLVRRCEASGARYIDVNPGYLSQRREDRMTFLVEAVQEATSKTLILDSPNPRVLAKGLEACREAPILNALTLEPQKIQEILPLAAQHGAPLIVLLLDERSFTPPTMEEKLSLAVELSEHAASAGLGLGDLIFDPVLPNLSWHDGYHRVGQVVETVRLFAGGAVFQEPVKTVVGLSNLRSGLRRQIPFQVEAVCLSLLAGAGLHMVLADALDPQVSETCRLIGQMTVDSALVE